MDAVWSALIAGVAGVVAGALPVWAVARRQPSRGVQDTVAIGGAYGGIIEHLQSELSRLSGELDDARRVAGESRKRVEELEAEAAALRGRVAWLEAEVQRLGGRV